MVINVKNGVDKTSSNSHQDCIHFVIMNDNGCPSPLTSWKLNELHRWFVYRVWFGFMACQPL